MNTAKTKKKELRKQILSTRDKITREKRQSEEDSVLRKLEEMGIFKTPKTVFVFLSYASEIDTKCIINRLLDAGSTVYIPRVNVTTKKMDACLYTIGEELAENKYGINEPLASSPAEDPKNIDIVICPGSAFTKDLDRMGYGGGYYDKFFPKLRDDAKLIAICYDEQIVEYIPTEEHDRKMDYIVSASAIYTSHPL